MKALAIKYCRSHDPICNARIHQGEYSLCCRYGWCGWAEPSQNRKGKPVSKVREKDFKPITKENS